MNKLALASLFAFSSAALAVEPAPPRGEEVEVTAGAVTSLSCALAAQKTGDLSLLNACPLAETKTGIVIFDVAEKQIYMTSKKKVARHELESAYGGGSIDFVAVVQKVSKAGVATVDVSEYSITKKKKAGSFKGCL